MQTYSNGVHPSREELIALRLLARNLFLEPQQAAQSIIAGNQRSPFRGRGMDYIESRNYQAGDDIRNMDWRVTARSGHPHVKVYQEERERPVVIIADFGPNMFFATEGAFKSIIVTRAAALIGWAAIQNGDRIGALLYNSVHHELRPTRGKCGVLRLIRELVNAAEPTQHSQGMQNKHNHFNDALTRLRRVTRPGSLIFIFSDFYHLNSDSKRHLQLLRRHNDVIACQIFDRIELRPPAPGRYPVMYGKQQCILDTRSKKQCASWIQHFAERYKHTSELLQACSIPLLQLSTADDVSKRLREQLTAPNISNTIERAAA